MQWCGKVVLFPWRRHYKTNYLVSNIIYYESTRVFRSYRDTYPNSKFFSKTYSGFVLFAQLLPIIKIFFTKYNLSVPFLIEIHKKVRKIYVALCYCYYIIIFHQEWVRKVQERNKQFSRWECRAKSKNLRCATQSCFKSSFNLLQRDSTLNYVDALFGVVLIAKMIFIWIHNNSWMWMRVFLVRSGRQVAQNKIWPPGRRRTSDGRFVGAASFLICSSTIG